MDSNSCSLNAPSGSRTQVAIEVEVRTVFESLGAVSSSKYRYLMPMISRRKKLKCTRCTQLMSDNYPGNKYKILLRSTIVHLQLLNATNSNSMQL